MKRLALILCLCLLLGGCVPAPEAVPTQAPTSAPTQAPTTAPTQAPTAAPTELPTEPPTEPPTEAPTFPYTNPLTGEGTMTNPVYRPFCVMLNNVKDAMPLHGVADADILYEVLVEYGETRLMAIFSDIASARPIGSVRSARKYFVSLAMGYDAIYVHYGKSDVPGDDVGAQQYLEQTGWDHMDGTGAGYSYFYDNTDRLQQGYQFYHCRFLQGIQAIQYAKDHGFRLSRDHVMDHGLRFDPELKLSGTAANTLTVWFNQGGATGSWTKSTKLVYDPNSGKYLSYQHGMSSNDGNTGQQLAFENVLILRANTRKHTGSDLLYVDVVGSGSGWFVHNGQMVEILWSRDSATSNFVYTYTDGTPLTLGVGKTYIAVTPHNAAVPTAE